MDAAPVVAMPAKIGIAEVELPVTGAKPLMTRLFCEGAPGIWMRKFSCAETKRVEEIGVPASKRLAETGVPWHCGTWAEFMITRMPFAGCGEAASVRGNGPKLAACGASVFLRAVLRKWPPVGEWQR